MIAFEAVTLRAGGFTLQGVSFEIPDGGYGVLMGKTGSGKTTMLEAICGLRRVGQGRILLAGKDVTGLRPADRGIGYVVRRVTDGRNLCFKRPPFRSPLPG